VPGDFRAYGNRIAQIFRERNVDIPTQHLMRAIRLFIAEEEGTKGKASAGQERRQAPAAAEEKQPTSGKYEISEQPSAVVREEDFAKQLRMARYLAASVCRRHGRWNRSYRQRRLNRRDPLERRGVKAKYNRRNKSLGRRN
jgi:hypothetical protein